MSARPSPKTGTLKLRLYVVADAPNSVRAVLNAQALCEAHFLGRFELEVVDLVKFPQRALDDGVVVTPTLIRLWPLPLQRIIGNLSDVERVLTVLGGGA